MGKLSAVRRGHAALRRGRVSLANQTYLVTFTTLGRRPLFADPVMAAQAARALTGPRAWTRSQLLAWVLMPDHWHGLVQLGTQDYLPAMVQRLKSNSARHVRQAVPETGHVWARAYHDRALRADEDPVAAARYIVMNPIRAGLVTRAGDYPYWNAVWL